MTTAELRADARLLSDEDLADIQGLVLYGTRAPFLRYHFFEVQDAVRARALVGSLLEGGLRVSAAGRYVQADQKGQRAPLYVGFTGLGLRALGVDREALKAFPQAFLEGARARANEVGDAGPSAPEHWTLVHDQLHIAVLLYGRSRDEFEKQSADLVARATGGGCALVDQLDGRALDDGPHASGQQLRNAVHFGFTDSVSQPILMGSAKDKPGGEPPVAPGHFVLGHPVDAGAPPSAPRPGDLLHNGTFGAFRLLEQDCDAFEQFLDDAAPSGNADDRERLAARLCGRWRNGRPLALSPDGPGTTPASDELPGLNRFDYRPSKAYPDAVDDRAGLRCPIGAHIRRAHPRSADILGRIGNEVRLIRRGMPYGDPHVRGDGKKRGMLGLFLCASLQEQFEFVQQHWINDGLFARGLSPADTDPLTGTRSAPGSFSYRTEAGVVTAAGLPNFVTTRGAAYLFFPSLTGLAALAALQGAPPARLAPDPALAMTDEDRIAFVVANMRARVGTDVHRDAHPKHHGLVAAKFTVIDDVPRELRHGLFETPGASYCAYVRFSNGNPRPTNPFQPDFMRDVRGMAIKLIGVDGPKLMPDEARTHDFILASFPQFFTRDLGHYLRFLTTDRQFLFREFPLLGASFGLFRSPLSIRYFSQTPYQLGPDLTVKYQIEPVDPAPQGPIDQQTAVQFGDPNYLRAAMATHLDSRDAVLEFKVQPQTHPVSMPVDDATVRWTSPAITVARLTLFKQVFQTPAHDHLARSLAFSPWHALAAHTPRGSINAVRRAVYIEASKQRLANAGQSPQEPDGSDEVLGPFCA